MWSRSLGPCSWPLPRSCSGSSCRGSRTSCRPPALSSDSPEPAPWTQAASPRTSSPEPIGSPGTTERRAEAPGGDRSSGQRPAARPHSGAALEPAAEGRRRRQRRAGRRVRERRVRREARNGVRPRRPTPVTTTITPSVARTRRRAAGRGGTAWDSLPQAPALWAGTLTNAAAQHRAARASAALHCGVEGAGLWSALQTPPSSRQRSARPPARRRGCVPAAPWPSSPHFIFTGRGGGGGGRSFPQ